MERNRGNMEKKKMKINKASQEYLNQKKKELGFEENSPSIFCVHFRRTSKLLLAVKTAKPAVLSLESSGFLIMERKINLSINTEKIFFIPYEDIESVTFQIIGLSQQLHIIKHDKREVVVSFGRKVSEKNPWCVETLKILKEKYSI